MLKDNRAVKATDSPIKTQIGKKAIQLITSGMMFVFVIALIKIAAIKSVVHVKSADIRSHSCALKLLEP